VEERQHRSDGPDDKPVRLFPYGGRMYIGEWNAEKKRRYGFGVHCNPNWGSVQAGLWKSSLMTSGSELYLPGSSTWMTNKCNRSEIKSLPSHNTKKAVHGLPFIYIGCFKKSNFDDPHARVILKDGTTRIGPWKKHEPVGDWWKDHAKSTTTPEELARILSFTETEHQEGVVVKLEASSDEDQEDSEAVDTKKEAKNKKKRRHEDIQSMEDIQSIAERLAEDVIGCKVRMEHMEKYAQELLNLGFHSLEFVKSECEPADVAAFDWMKTIHKRRFLARTGLHKTKSKS